MNHQRRSEDDVTALINKIEYLRKELHKLVGEEIPSDFNQEEIYWLSQRLDKLIVQFMRQEKKQKNEIDQGEKKDK
ncbi:MAG TPA: aspartyl-phosphate phosphatase Spo0E family protein [Clostridia bacterium]|nr:aspartyl-phosphate phosphatase Spo0E family protein [Clostridia bacterium]